MQNPFDSDFDVHTTITELSRQIRDPSFMYPSLEGYEKRMAEDIEALRHGKRTPDQGMLAYALNSMKVAACYTDLHPTDARIGDCARNIHQHYAELRAFFPRAPK